MNILLGLFPNHRGIGYVCIEQPKNLLEHGIATCRPLVNTGLLKRVTRFIDYFKPSVVVLRDPEAYSHSKRIQKLTEQIVRLAIEKKIPVYQYSREQIRYVFELYGAHTKHEICQKLVEWFPELKPKAPKLRKAYDDESVNMGIFDALALCAAHEYLKK